LQVTVHLIPAPSIVLSIQMYFSALFVKALKELRYLEADDLEWGKVSVLRSALIATYGNRPAVSSLTRLIHKLLIT
jgi:hypothetical protein